MARTVIFGNSGSGKSTLARKISSESACPCLDLDTIAWDPEFTEAVRAPIETTTAQIDLFVSGSSEWVVEGCYTDLLKLVVPHCTKIVFLNPGVGLCVRNARKRPWEPHKYQSQEAQDANLEMLISWIGNYAERDDDTSLRAHQRLFANFQGEKVEYTSNSHGQ